MKYLAKEKFEQKLGTRERVVGKKKVVVVGGGLAGVAAATVLAEHGVEVTVIEREPVLGGRVSGWSERLKGGETFEMERGFHAFFRQYYNLRNLLKRIDPELRHLMPLADYPVFGPDGYQESFESLPTTPPLNVVALVHRTSTLKFADLIKTNALAAMAMLSYDREKTYTDFDGLTAREYLDSLNFPADARRMLFDVFSHSFFNPEDRMSAAELLMMFHFYFMGNPEGLIFDVLVEPFSDALWKPFGRYLTERGVMVKTRSEATAIEPGARGSWKVSLKGHKTKLVADGVVLALTVPALQKVISSSNNIDLRLQQAVEGLDITLPFAVWRMWLDKPVRVGRHPFVGTAGLGIIDNISVYELFEGESRRWAMRTGGSVVEVHAYAVPQNYSEAQVKKELKSRLHELYPETKSARILDERFLFKQDCPAFKPGFSATRPEVKTVMEGLMLAGDFVKTPFPSALMEKATATGFMAANYLLERWNVRGEEIWSIPTKGMFSWLPSLSNL